MPFPVPTPVPGYDARWTFQGTGFRWLMNPTSRCPAGFPQSWGGALPVDYAAERASFFRTMLTDVTAARDRVAAEGAGRYWPSHVDQHELRPVNLVSPLQTAPGSGGVIATVPGWRLVPPGDTTTLLGPVSTARPGGGYAFTELQILQHYVDGATGMIAFCDFWAAHPIATTFPPADQSVHRADFGSEWDASFVFSPYVVSGDPWVRAP